MPVRGGSGRHLPSLRSDRSHPLHQTLAEMHPATPLGNAAHDLPAHLPQVAGHTLIISLCLRSLLHVAPLFPSSFFFFFNDPAPPEIYTLPLPDPLPILIAPCDDQSAIATLQACFDECDRRLGERVATTILAFGIGVELGEVPPRRCVNEEVHFAAGGGLW